MFRFFLCSIVQASLHLCPPNTQSAPELIDDFIPRVVGLLTDRTHATIMTGTTLMWHMARMKPAVLPRFAKAVPHLAKLLRKLVVSTNVPNYTIGRVCDPFLQVSSQLACPRRHDATVAFEAAAMQHRFA